MAAARSSFRGRRLLLPVALVVLAGLAWGLARTGLEPYRQFDSPDGTLRVEVWRARSLLAMMPGQAGDAAGEVRLVARDGRVLATTPVDMVQMVDAVDWTGDGARIKFVADWDRDGRPR